MKTPEAQKVLDTVAHETIEAITDPVGTGWMDPNGEETADKCENPEEGTPLGFASDGSPYNQLIDGHPYLVQDVWSNPRKGCVQSSTAVGSTPPLHTVDLRQFSPSVSGTPTSSTLTRSEPGRSIDGRAHNAHTPSRNPVNNAPALPRYSDAGRAL